MRPFSFIKSSASVFDPATAALTGWWRDYSGSPDAGRSSTGTSATHSLTEATNPPAVGASLNGHASADFDGTNDKLTGADISAFVSATRISIGGLISSDTAVAQSVGAGYADPGILSDAGSGRIYVSFSNGGVTFGFYNGSTYVEITKACATGSQHLFAAWYQGTHLNLEVDGVAATPVASATGPALLAANLQLGQSYSGAALFNGRRWDLYTSDIDLGATYRTNYKSYINSRYSLSI